MRLQPVSGPLVIILCIFSFLFGRLTQQGAQLPEPVQVCVLPSAALASIAPGRCATRQGHYG